MCAHIAAALLLHVFHMHLTAQPVQAMGNPESYVNTMVKTDIVMYLQDFTKKKKRLQKVVTVLEVSFASKICRCFQGLDYIIAILYPKLLNKVVKTSFQPSPFLVLMDSFPKEKINMIPHLQKCSMNVPYSKTWFMKLATFVFAVLVFVSLTLLHGLRMLVLKMNKQKHAGILQK